MSDLAKRITQLVERLNAHESALSELTHATAQGGELAGEVSNLACLISDLSGVVGNLTDQLGALITETNDLADHVHMIERRPRIAECQSCGCFWIVAEDRARHVGHGCYDECACHDAKYPAAMLVPAHTEWGRRDDPLPEPL